MAIIINNKQITKLCLNLFFPCSIIIDLLNGYLQLERGFHSPIGILYRLNLLFLVAYNLIKSKKVPLKNYIISWTIICLISLGCWIITYGVYNNNFLLNNEFNELVRIVYFYLAISFFLRHKFEPTYILNYINNYGTIIAGCIIISFITGFGHYTYGENYGFGTKSWFVAGNDLGITLIFSLISSSIVLFNSLCPINLLKFGLITIGSVLIGSRVGIIGTIIVLVYSFLYYLFIFTPSKKQLLYYKLSILLFIPILLYSIIIFSQYIYNSLDAYAISRFSLDSIGDARKTLTDDATTYINSLRGISFLFGNGASEFYSSIAKIGDYTVEYKSPETDIYDLIGSYGYILGIYTLIPYICWLVMSIRIYLYNKNYTNSCASLICLLFVCVGTLSGHCIKNIMVAPIYGFYISILYKEYENINNFKHVSIKDGSLLRNFCKECL